MDCLLGIDLGTTNLKCVAFSCSGHVLAKSTASTPCKAEGESRASYDPEAIWQRASHLIRTITASLPREAHIAGIAAASVGESVVPLAGDGSPIFNALAWFDTRPGEGPLPSLFGQHASAIRRLTGIAPDHTFSAAKAAWFKQAHPDLYGATRAWLPMADYIAFRLSGVQAVSLSLASRTMLFDLAGRRWSHELFDAFRLDASQWPDLVPGGTPIGRVSEHAARETGLPEGAIVAAGGHDHLCGALAAGATEPGVILDSMGTTEAILAPLSEPLIDEALSRSGFSAGCHAVPDRYYVITGITGSGGLCAWLRRVLLGHVADDDAAFRFLERLAASSPPGANGVRVWPAFAGANPRRPGTPGKGLISGLTTETEAGDIARAALEALSAEFAQTLKTLAKRTGHPTLQIILTGGASGNTLWHQIKAAMSNHRLAVQEMSEAGCLGAAILAGMAAGIYTNENDALRQVAVAKKEIYPRPEDVIFYKTYSDFSNENK